MPRLLSCLAVFAVGWFTSRLDLAPRSALAAPPADFATLIEGAEPSIVHVTVQTGDPRAPRSRDDAVGSGFVLGPDGLVATSRHLLQGARAIFVQVAGREPVAAEIVGHDESVDVTVLRLPSRGLVPLAAGSSRGLRPGDWVLACGSPYGLARSWSAGIVSGLHRRQVAPDPRTYEDFIQTDAAANLGNSGGPLLDVSGRAVGMLTQILTRGTGFQGLSLATPIEAVLEAVARITGGGAPARPALGAVVRERPGPGGLEVTQVHPASGAQAGGLAAGDVIVGLDGIEVLTNADLARALWGRRAGETARVRYLRGGQAREAAVVLR